MANDTVTIFFKAEGDKTLKAAINALDKATRDLVNSSAMNSKVNKRLVRENKKLEQQLKKSNLQFAKQNSQGLLSVKSNRLLAGSFATIRSQLLLASFAMTLIIDPLRQITESMREQTESVAKLKAGLKNIGLTSEDASDKLITYAGALQKVTTFGDEQIINAAAILTTFQLTEDSIAKLLPRVLDLSAAMGTDLTSAATQIGKAFTGLPAGLSKSGVIIDKLGLQMAKAISPTEEFSFLIDALDNNFEGFARSLAETDIGKLDQLRNILSDLKEDVAETALPFNILTEKVKIFALEVFNIISKLGSEGFDIGKILVDRKLEQILKEAKEAILAFGDGSTNVTKAIRKQRMEQANLIALYEMELKFLKDDGVIDAKEQLAINALKNVQITQLEIKGLISKEEAIKRILKLEIENIKLQKTKLQLFQEGSKSAGVLADSLVDLAKGNKEETIAALRLAQAAAIGDAIAGSMKAFKEGGITGFLAGTALLAQGLARIQQINAQISAARQVQFAEGGLIGGKRHSQGGTLIEAEKGEFILRRSAVQAIGVETANRINNGEPVGGGITVNGDIYGFDDFREKVEQANKVNGMGLA